MRCSREVVMLRAFFFFVGKCNGVLAVLKAEGIGFRGTKIRKLFYFHRV
jgi:hypothetical protein